MKLLQYILFIINIYKVEVYFIENKYKPICQNCKYFIPNKNECRKFGDMNIITGKYTYESAISVRNDEDKCGEYAIFFKKNNFKFITIPYYFILENGIMFSFLIYCAFPFILWYIFL
jgi:hypothetical protein